MKKSKHLIFMAIVGTLVFSSCTTTSLVKMDYTATRPAKYEFNDEGTISVLPFSAEKVNNDLDWYQFIKKAQRKGHKQEFANEITNSLASKINEETSLTVIDSEEVEKALANKTEAPCNLYLTGCITDWEESVSKDGLLWYKDIDVTIEYKIVDVKTNKVKHSSWRSISGSSDGNLLKLKLPDSVSILLDDVDNATTDIISDILKYSERYSVNKSTNLVKITRLGKTTDPDEIEFNKAVRCAEEKLYEESEASFLSLYQKGNAIAGYNAAVVMQLNGKYEQALTLMNEVYKNCTSDKTVQYYAPEVIKDLKVEVSYSEKLKK